MNNAKGHVRYTHSHKFWYTMEMKNSQSQLHKFCRVCGHELYKSGKRESLLFQCMELWTCFAIDMTLLTFQLISAKHEDEQCAMVQEAAVNMIA